MVAVPGTESFHDLGRRVAHLLARGSDSMDVLRVSCLRIVPANCFEKEFES